MRKWILLGTFLVLLWWRWQVALSRFFDVDEFSYLHWTANLVKGDKPYTDFFLIFTPGFLWAFAPIVKAYWMSAGVFVASRVAAFFIFLGILGCLGVLFGKTRGWKWALLPMIILAFLPMPYDKFLEVRPDNLATLLALIGVIGEIWAIREGKRSRWFVSGVFYSLSLLVFIKTLPFVVVGVGIAWFMNHKKEFFVGLGVPFMLFFFWLLMSQNLGVAWYSFAKLPFETTLISKTDIMEPHLFFFPNASFYGPPAGGGGLTSGLLANHALWIMGILMGVFRLFTPYLTGEVASSATHRRGGKKMLVEVLLAGTFIVLVYGYVQFFPLKHSQYLIPIAIFVAFYAADALRIFFDRIKWALLVFGLFIIIVNAQVNAPKLSMNNAVQIAQMEKLLAIVPRDARVLDLEGRMLFWPDAYYICCVSFGSFTQFMSRKPPALSEELEKDKVPYIFQGDSNRLPYLSPPDRTFIQTHYDPVPGWGEALLQWEK